MVFGSAGDGVAASVVNHRARFTDELYMVVIWGRPKPSPAMRERVAEGRVRAQVSVRTIAKRQSPHPDPLPRKAGGEGELSADPNERLQPSSAAVARLICTPATAP